MGAWFRWIKKLYQYLNEKLEGVKASIQGVGNTYFVDISGLDSNDGLTPAKALKTITAALAKCVDDHDDYIYVLDCWDADTYPITIDKSRVHIIGVGVPSMNLFPQLQGGTENIFVLNANYVEIAGLGFVSAGASAIVSGADNCSYGWIHHCTFATAALSLLNGIAQVGCQIGNMLIEDNMFGSNITNDGITGQLVNCRIRNNVFRDCVNIAVNLGAVEIGTVIGNHFFRGLDGAVAGWAITLAAAANGGIITDNKASQTGNAAGADNLPYVDASGLAVGSRLNGWAANYHGENVIVPA